MKTSLSLVAVLVGSSFVACGGEPPPPEVASADALADQIVVNGNTLSENERKHVAWLGEEVAPHVDVEKVAAVAWWSLKEGVLSLGNAHAHDLCTIDGDNVTIGPLETCGGAWQVGIAAAQVPNWSFAQVGALVTQGHGAGADEAALLRHAAELAGAPVDAVVNSAGDLRTSWLLRDGATGVLATYEALLPCLSDFPRWCGGGWDAAQRYGNTPDSVRRAIADLQAVFERGGVTAATNPAPAAADPYVATDNGDSANVRGGPGTSYRVLGTVADGTHVTIQCQAAGESIDGNDVWDYVADRGGYIADVLVVTGTVGFDARFPRCP